MGLPSGLFPSGFPTKTLFCSTKPTSDLGRLTVEAELKQLDTLPVGLLWKSEQLVAEATTYTVQKTQEQNIHALNRIWTRDSISTPCVARPPRSAGKSLDFSKRV